MKVGLVLPTVGPHVTAELVAGVANAAERCGFASLWVSDHLAVPARIGSVHPKLGTGTGWMTEVDWLDPLVALAFAASAATTVELGTAVLLLPLREPLAVAKAVATVDRLAAGRLQLGVGAGWLAEEFSLVGAPFAQRGRALERAVATLRACWGPDPVVLPQREHVDPVVVRPKPSRGAALPILVGGTSASARARAAAIGDGWLPSNLSPDDLRRGIADYRARCAARDRPAGAVVLRVGHSIELDDELVAAYRRAGVATLVAELGPPGTRTCSTPANLVGSVASVVGL